MLLMRRTLHDLGILQYPGSHLGSCRNFSIHIYTVLEGIFILATLH